MHRHSAYICNITDRFVIYHAPQEVMERCFLNYEILYKGHLAWLLLIHILFFDEDTAIQQLLQQIVEIFEDIFWCHI